MFFRKKKLYIVEHEITIKRLPEVGKPTFGSLFQRNYRVIPNMCKPQLWMTFRICSRKRSPNL